MRFFYIKAILLVGILIFSSCEDIIFEKFEGNIPIYLSYDDLKQSINVNEPREINQPGKIYFCNNYILINEYLKGIHVIDNSNPSSPTQIQFIEIPGNTDLLIYNDILFVDSYIDLVALDINNFPDINEVQRSEDIFPYSLPPTNNDLRIAIITNKIIKQKSEEITGRNLTSLFELLEIKY